MKNAVMPHVCSDQVRNASAAGIVNQSLVQVDMVALLLWLSRVEAEHCDQTGQMIQIK